MIENITPFFKNVRPSIAGFNEQTSGLFTGKKLELVRNIYQASLVQWPVLSGVYKGFTLSYIQEDLHGFLKYMNECTVFSQLKYTLRNPQMSYQLIELLEGDLCKHSSTRTHLSFHLLNSFHFDRTYSIHTLNREMRIRRISTDDMLFLCGKSPITNVDDELY